MSNLITLDEFKAYKRVENNDEDASLSLIIASASAFAKTYCRRSFVDYFSTDKVEYHDGTKDSVIYLDELPLLSVTSVEHSIDGGVSYSSYTVNEDYYVDEETSSITSGYEDINLSTSSIGLKSLKITYKAGYEEAPEDIKLAILDLVEYYRSEEYTPRKAFQGISVENLGFRESSGSSLPSHIKRIFEMYRRSM